MPAGRFDVSGGWYDAGDYGKYTVCGSIAVWQLLNLPDLLRRTAGAAAVSEPALLEECRWQLDWLPRMQVPRVSHRQAWPSIGFTALSGRRRPGWAHEDPTIRVLHRPSTAATLHVAAVGAWASRLLRHIDDDYAARLLTAARIAHGAAHAHPNLIAPDDEGRFGGVPYGDPDVHDDFYWAATELWLVTGEDSFRTELEEHAQHSAEVFDADGFDFDNVAALAWLELASNHSDLPDQDRVADSVTQAAQQLLDLQRRQPWGQPYAPAGGWAWGSNGRILTNLIVLATAAQVTDDRNFTTASLPAWITSWVGTPSARAMSLATALTRLRTCEPDSLAAISTHPSRHRRPERWPAGPTPGRRPAFPATHAYGACRLSAVT